MGSSLPPVMSHSIDGRVGLMAGMVFQISSPNWSLWGALWPFVLVQLMGSHSPGQLPLPQHFLQHLTAVSGNSPTGLTYFSGPSNPFWASWPVLSKGDQGCLKLVFLLL